MKICIKRCLNNKFNRICRYFYNNIYVCINRIKYFVIFLLKKLSYQKKKKIVYILKYKI